jgi:hypothetical protein
MPELRDLLDEKLNPEQDPSPAVRAVFGQYLPNLLYLDSAWTEQHLAEVFPRVEGREQLRAAAWAAYVRLARLSPATIEQVLPEFRHAIAQLRDDARAQLGDEDTRLAEYVGEIFLSDLDDQADPVVNAFFQQAAVGLRTHAIRHLGLSLARIEVTDEQRERLEQLWRGRLEQLNDGDVELREYGWWFASRKLPDDEALELLVSTLEKSGGLIENVKEVLEALVSLAAANPAAANRTLELIIDGCEWYLLDYSREPIRAIIEAVLEARDEDATQTAHSLIDSLGERGIHGMQDLQGA